MAEKEYTEALTELLYKMADDQYIFGHRTSEWIGIGPILEEDIAFGSLAQDKVGQAYNLYQLLNNLGEAEPDKLVFGREEKEYKSSHLAELPIGEYDFAIVRHFLFDNAEYLRFGMLENSSYQPLANLARKFRTEIKYHIFHANTWLKQLAQGNEESKGKMQSALNYAYPYALGIFEEGPYEDFLRKEYIFAGESALKAQWLENVNSFIESIGLKVPEVKEATLGMGGRKGFHTEYFAPLIHEMKEVFVTEDSGAEW